MRKLFISFIMMFCIGCATCHPMPLNEFQHSYNQSFNTVWSASLKMLTMDGFPIKTIDKENGLIHTDFIPTTYVIYKARYAISLFFISERNSTKVIITPHYEVYYPNRVGSLSAGEWLLNTERDRIIIDKYLQKLDSIIL